MATDPDFVMQLPDELLLNVAHHMAAPDLVNLSLVSKRLGAIAQEALHRSPQHICGGSNLVSLSTTLIRRSDLAGKVTKLTIMVGREKESSPLSFFVVNGGNNSAVASVQDNIEILVEEAQIAGYLLTHLLSLKELDLTVLRKMNAPVYSPYRYGWFPIKSLFGYETTPELSQIPGLANLRTLRLDAGALEWPWCTLPHLRTLKLGLYSHIGDYREWSGTSNIEDLILTCTTEILLQDDSRYQHLQGFLTRCPKIKELHFLIGNYCFDSTADVGDELYEMLDENEIGSFDTLVSHITPLALSLEYLTIGNAWDANPDFLQYTSPVTSLAQFTALKRLAAPYNSLFDHPPSVPARLLHSILPRNLELLRIFCPHIEVLERLHDIVRYPECFPEVLLIYLHTRNCQGDSYEHFAYKHHPVYNQLDLLYISCKISYLEEDYREEWDDEDYDPFVCDIVLWLRSLKPQLERILDILGERG